MAMGREVFERIKVGVFGGAFDPVHNEHVRLMETVIERLGLEKLVLLPSGNAPHKRTGTPFDKRVAMLEIATAHIPEVVIDTAEERVETPTYSSEMLPRLRKKYGDFVHVIGGDSIVAMPTWHLPQEVMRYPTVVVARGAVDETLEKAVRYAEVTYKADVLVLPVCLEDVSSTAIRLAYRVGKTPDGHDLAEGQKAWDEGGYYPMSNGVCYGVHNYIRSYGLYDEYHAIVNEVPRHISQERWAHSREVALMAVRLNGQLHLPEDKVITAALLHDCMKGATHVYPAVPADARQPGVLHAFNGAEEARYRYGVEDEEILAAIRYHTTGRAGMSDLEKLIYLADYCEATRTFEGAAEVREVALANFEEGFVLAVKKTHDHVHEKGGEICPYGDECYRYYCKE